MNRTEILQTAKRRIDEKRASAEKVCAETLEKLRANAEYRTCETELKKAEISFAFGDGEKKENAQKNIEKYAKMRKKLLKNEGLSEEDLLPKYSCAKCGDTGYVDGRTCVCLQNEIRALLAAGSNVIDPAYTFESSTETDKNNATVYKNVKKAVCDGKNVLLSGNTGTGKTYLMTACANLALQQNKSALFLTAYALSNMFLQCHLGDFAEKQAVLESLNDVDVLCIDDLGTEIIYKNVTAEYLFSVINERNINKKQTFLSTNLSLKDLRDRYDERMFSRLTDQSVTVVGKLDGLDKRLQKAVSKSKKQ